MSNDGSGCAGYILGGVLLALVLAAVVAWTGLPTWDGSLNWNTDATYERQLTERERIAEQGRTERERIAADAETSRTWAIALTFMVAAGSAAGAVVAWSRRPHRPVPPTVLALLARLPADDAYQLEEVNGEYRFVSDRRNDWMTIEDAARLLETR